MPLIDRTYFIGEINIPNTNQPAVQENIDYLIKKREPELLTQLFGYEMYKAFTTGLAAPTPEQRWLDLRDGVDYTDTDGLSRRWMGLVTKEAADPKQSLIANYVYYWFTRKEATQSSGVGEVVTKTENSKRVSPISKQVRAWNEMVNWIWELYDYLEAKEADYPELEARNKCQWTILNPFNI